MFKLLNGENMGKSKKRIFNKSGENNGSVIKRTDAVKQVINSLKKNIINNDIKNNISLFGITADELLEAGASFEDISAVKNILN
ncbi:hypothetical protein II906_02405 [bacterium]|nr:hypothetical protein [bacterium]